MNIYAGLTKPLLDLLFLKAIHMPGRRRFIASFIGDKRRLCPSDSAATSASLQNLQIESDISLGILRKTEHVNRIQPARKLLLRRKVQSLTASDAKHEG